MSSRILFKFRLYVAGDTQNSAMAMANLATLCREHLPDIHEIEIIDVFKHPKRALADGILMTPTLLKLGPLPIRKIIGVLSPQDLVLRTLGVEKVAP